MPVSLNCLVCLVIGHQLLLNHYVLLEKITVREGARVIFQHSWKMASKPFRTPWMPIIEFLLLPRMESNT